MKVSEALEAAWALIDTPEKWTKNAYARNSAGKELDVTVWGRAEGSAENKAPVCFCSRGAIRYAAKDGHLAESAEQVLGKAIIGCLKDERYDGVLNFNDDHTYEEVKKAWKLAIRLAKETDDESH